MLTLHPVPEFEPPFLHRARATIDAAPHHPDADEIRQALDVLAHAMTRLSQLAEKMVDAAAREAISGDSAALQDAVTDLEFAVECWAERPENEPAALCNATRADFLIMQAREC